MNSLGKIYNRNMNILVGLYSIHNHGSLTRAADELCITQPAVSKILYKVRDVCGNGLFKRVMYGVKPTEKMTSVMPAIEQLIKLSDDIYTALGADSALDFSLDIYSEPATKMRALELENAELKSKIEAARSALS